MITVGQLRESIDGLEDDTEIKVWIDGLHESGSLGWSAQKSPSNVWLSDAPCEKVLYIEIDIGADDVWRAVDSITSRSK